jgi:pantetheine-phosphate adenylyltransferase
MAPDTTYSFLSSSLVREVARLGANVDAFVSPAVARRLSRRFAEDR